MRIWATHLLAVLAVGASLVATACVAGGHPGQAAGSRHRTAASAPPTDSTEATAATASGLPPTATSCVGAANTPGGPDPWGGCWPGPENTGPPAGLSLTPYQGQVLPDGACTITVNTVIADNTIACQIIVKSGNLTLEDSSLTGEVYNYGQGQVLIEDSTINGGSAHTETVLGSNITIVASNLYGNQHEVYCGSDCTIENSWLHGNHDFGPADHQNGFLSTGGTHYDLQHNTIDCSGHCTSDIAFLGSDSDAIVNRNLLMSGPAIAYCLYAYSGGRTSTVVNQMTITDNVFQLGSTTKCASYGPTAGWDEPNDNPGTSGYRNKWSGNTWNDGQALQAP